MKDRLAADIQGLFGTVFSDGEERIGGYANWYYEWGRSWDLLWQGVSSTVTRLGEVRVETLREAVQRDITDYFMQHFTAQVLRPEFRDPLLQQGIRRALTSAHERYVAAVRAQHLELQLFLARQTTHLDPAAGTNGLRIAFDWDAQRWKAPIYLMEDRAFDGVQSLLTAGAGGTLAGAALGPVIEEMLAAVFAEMAAETAVGVTTELEAGAAGAAAGSWFPGVGTAIGAAGGLLAAVGLDYAWNKGREWVGREEFETQNRTALAAVRTAWEGKVIGALGGAVDVWFADTGAALTKLSPSIASSGG